MIEKWISGILFYPEAHFIPALYNECNRIFRDRLIKKEDVELFNDIVKSAFHHFHNNFNNDDELFVPRSDKGSKMLDYTDIDAWAEIVNNGIALCSKYEGFLDIE